jgi:N-hydroxyarylamine O-acetyltransferase
MTPMTTSVTHTLSPTQAQAYLSRIGATPPAGPTLAALSSLHRAHLLAVPFESLDIHLGRPIRLDTAGLVAKVVGDRRGGYCYELNGLFALLLQALGYDVDLVSARVATSEGGLTDDFDHLTLVVRSEAMDEPVLADVGFGDAFIEPLPLRHGFVRREPGKDVGLVLEGDHWHYRERRDGEPWHMQYVFTTTAHPLPDFEPRNVWQQTSADSHFTRRRVASRLTQTGRITLSDRRLVVTSHGRREERELDDAEVATALHEDFGIVLH